MSERPSNPSKTIITTLNAKYIHTNLAIRLLYQLNKNRVEHLYWKEFTIKQPIEDIVNSLMDFDQVAFSCYIWNIIPILECVKQLKQRNPRIRILLGGPEVSYDAESIFNNNAVDAVCYDEGEQPFSEWIQNSQPLSQIPGIYWKSKTGIIKNPPAPKTPVECLAALQPYADDDVTELPNKVLYIETSRGCPYKCEFCLASLDNKIRYLPETYIFNTLLFLIKHGKTIKFLDRTFNLKKEFTLKVFEFILKHHRPGQTFQFEITSDILHPDVISFIQQRVPPGLLRFEIGIQSIHAESNRAVGRFQNFEKTRKVILQIKEHVILHLDLIAGLPHERFQDVLTGIDTVMALQPDELQLGVLKFLKGTPLREYQQYNYRFMPQPPYTLISSDFISATELVDLQRIEWALDTLWNGHKMPHWIRYMSQQHSISRVFLLFSQRMHQASKTLHYQMQDLFKTALALLQELTPNDPVAQSLLALDYYAYFKLKPSPMVRLPLRDSEKKHHCRMAGIQGHFGSYLVIPFDLDYTEWSTRQVVKPASQILIFEYKGQEKAKLRSYEPKTMAV